MNFVWSNEHSPWSGLVGHSIWLLQGILALHVIKNLLFLVNDGRKQYAVWCNGWISVLRHDTTRPPYWRHAQYLHTVWDYCMLKDASSRIIVRILCTVVWNWWSLFLRWCPICCIYLYIYKCFNFLKEQCLGTCWVCVLCRKTDIFEKREHLSFLMDVRVWRWVRIYFRLLALFFLEDIYTVKHHRSFSCRKQISTRRVGFVVWWGTKTRFLALAAFRFDMMTALW